MIQCFPSLQLWDASHLSLIQTIRAHSESFEEPDEPVWNEAKLRKREINYQRKI